MQQADQTAFPLFITPPHFLALTSRLAISAIYFHQIIVSGFQSNTALFCNRASFCFLFRTGRLETGTPSRSAVGLLCRM